ncbi:MAG: hypothetical protein ACRD3O_14580 [Terriglobia bacterium]
MNKKNTSGLFALIACCYLLLHAGASILWAQRAAASIGLFENHTDVGTVLHPGSVQYDASKGTYTISGSGENMWSSTDDFQFVWKKASGDVSLAADISFVGTGGNPHRKAVLMIRQSLDAGSVYADVALHGIGLTALQFRAENGAVTQEVRASVTSPKRLRIEKRGDYFYMFLGEGSELHYAARSPRLHLKAPFYVGIGVCSHDKDRVEKAIFSNVDLETSSPSASTHPAR